MTAARDPLPLPRPARKGTPLFIDTGAWYAYLNVDDPDHDLVRDALHEWDGPWVTTNYVFDEVVTLIRMRVSHQMAVKAGAAIRDEEVARVEWASEHDEAAAWRLFRMRKDKRYSMTDCTSFTVMKRLGLEVAAATDGDFTREGFHLVP